MGCKQIYSLTISKVLHLSIERRMSEEVQCLALFRASPLGLRKSPCHHVDPSGLITHAAMTRLGAYERGHLIKRSLRSARGASKHRPLRRRPTLLMSSQRKSLPSPSCARARLAAAAPTLALDRHGGSELAPPR